VRETLQKKCDIFESTEKPNERKSKKNKNKETKISKK